MYWCIFRSDHLSKLKQFFRQLYIYVCNIYINLERDFILSKLCYHISKEYAPVIILKEVNFKLHCARGVVFRTKCLLVIVKSVVSDWKCRVFIQCNVMVTKIRYTLESCFSLSVKTYFNTGLLVKKMAYISIPQMREISLTTSHIFKESWKQHFAF